MSNYKHVMLDLETMGTGPCAAITAIGAVAFNLDGGILGPSFYRAVYLGDSMQSGGVVDADTILWWMRQSKDAKQLYSKDTPVYSLHTALEAFIDFIREDTEGATKVRVWGNGAAFDNVVLRSTYERSGDLCAPWVFRNDRCYRTAKALYPHVALGKSVGVTHNAVDDAVYQAKHLIEIATIAGW